MGKLNINNGGVDTNKAMPNIDERYGPYNSFDEANAALGGSGRNVIVAGLKVGIRQSDGSIKEYSYQPNGKGQLELVAATGIPEQGAANDKVLGYENGKVAWVEKPVDGVDGVDGKSATEIYNDIHHTHLTDAEFIEVLKADYPMEYVAYDSDAYSTYTPFEAIDTLTASAATAGKMWLMPNDDNTETKLFVTVKTSGTDYMWYNLGVIDVPNNILTEDSVDDTRLMSPDGVSVARAYDVSNTIFGEYERDSIGEDIMNDSDIVGRWRVCFRETTNMSTNAKTLSTTDGENPNIYIKSAYLATLPLHSRLVVEKSGTYAAWVTFLKKTIPSGTMTLQELVDGDYLSYIHYKGNGVWNPVIKVYQETKEIEIPSDTYAVCFTKYWYNYESRNRLPDSVKIAEYTKISSGIVDKIPSVIDNTNSESVDDALSANQGRILDAKITEIDDRFLLKEQIDLSNSNKVSYFVSASTGKWTQGVNPMAHVAMPVNPGDKFEITPNNKYNTSYAFFTDDYDTIYNGTEAPTIGEDAPLAEGTEAYVITKGSATVDFTVPEGTKYLYLIYGNIKGGGSYLPQSLVLISIKDIPAYVNSASESLFMGYISENGELVKNDKYVTTQPIRGGFNIKLFDDFKIVRIVLFNADNIISNYSFIGSSPNRVLFGAYSYGNSDYQSLDKEDCRRTEFGILYIPEGFSCRIVISKEDASAISINDKIIKSLYSFSELLAYRSELGDSEASRAVWHRVNNIASVYFYCQQNFPVISESANKPYIGKNVAVGIPYSNAREKNGFVGYGCNIKNFITSIRNPRSVMYTENLKTNTSEYGMSYNNYAVANSSATYFGTVCSGLASYVYGCELAYQCRSMGIHTDEFSYLNRDNYDWNVYNMPPMTAIQSEAHIFVVVDFLVDRFGRRKFAIVAEEISPGSKLYVYSLEALQFRLDYIDRYYELDTPPQPVRYLIPVEGLLERNKNNFVDELHTFDVRDYLKKELPEVMTFCGDYASFPIGQSPIYINAIPSDKYDRMELYYKSPSASDYSLLQTLNISSYTPDENGVIDVDITQYVDDGGLYKVRLSDSSDSDVKSDYTYFEGVEFIATTRKVGAVSDNIDEVVITSYSGGTLFAKMFVYNWVPASDANSGYFSNNKDGFSYITQSEIDNNVLVFNSKNLVHTDSNSKLCVILKGTYNQVQFSYDVPDVSNS